MYKEDQISKLDKEMMNNEVMTEREFLVMCKIKLDEAIKENDGYNAHYYGKWLDHKEWLFMGRFLNEEFLNQNINTMETSSERPYGIGTPGGINSEVKPGTFVEAMIASQELLKHAEYLYEKIYEVQKQISPGVIHKNAGTEVGCGGITGNVSSIPDNARNLLLSPQVKGINIFQRMTDVINKTHKELDAIEKVIQYIYESIGVTPLENKTND
jgi:hypothetical protein